MSWIGDEPLRTDDDWSVDDYLSGLLCQARVVNAGLVVMAVALLIPLASLAAPVK